MLKEAKKKLKYASSCTQIQWMWNIKGMITPIITGATGIAAKGLKKNLEAIRGKRSINSHHKTAILETSHTLRKVLQFGTLKPDWWRSQLFQEVKYRGTKECDEECLHCQMRTQPVLGYKGLYKLLNVSDYIYIHDTLATGWTVRGSNPVSPGPGAHPAKRGADYPPHLAPKLKKEYRYTSTPALGLHDLF